MTRQSLTNPSRYLKHPAAGSWLLDGETLDAGSAIVLDSNLGHLLTESYRHLLWEVKAIVYPHKAGTGWTDLTDTSNPSGATGASTIPWDQTLARRWGPFVGLLTAGGSNGDLVKLRRMRLDITDFLGTSSPTITWHFALTLGTFGAGRSVGVPADGNTLWYNTLSRTPGSLSSTFDINVSGISRSVMDSAICRPSDGVSRGPTVVGVVPLNLWVGLESSSNSYLAEVHCLSLFEVPE